MLNINDIRRLKHSKNERVHIQKTEPTAKDLEENIPEIRVVQGRVYQYLKIGSKIYRNEFHPYDSRLKKTKLSSSSIQKTNAVGGGGWQMPSFGGTPSDWDDTGDPMWMKFDNGVIMQWGCEKFTGNATHEVMLPKKYDHDLWLIFANFQNNFGNQDPITPGRKLISGDFSNYYLDRFIIGMHNNGNRPVGWMTLGW